MRHEKRQKDHTGINLCTFPSYLFVLSICVSNEIVFPDSYAISQRRSTHWAYLQQFYKLQKLLTLHFLAKAIIGSEVNMIGRENAFPVDVARCESHQSAIAAQIRSKYEYKCSREAKYRSKGPAMMTHVAVGTPAIFGTFLTILGCIICCEISALLSSPTIHWAKTMSHWIIPTLNSCALESPRVARIVATFVAEPYE